MFELEELGELERPGDWPGRPQMQVVWWRAQEPHTGWTSLHCVGVRDLDLVEFPFLFLFPFP